MLTSEGSEPGEAPGPDSLLLDIECEYEYEGMSSSQAWNLYTSHFLSTWNARTYEFAAVSNLYREGIL